MTAQEVHEIFMRLAAIGCTLLFCVLVLLIPMRWFKVVMSLFVVIVGSITILGFDNTQVLLRELFQLLLG